MNSKGKPFFMFITISISCFVNYYSWPLFFVLIQQRSSYINHLPFLCYKYFPLVWSLFFNFVYSRLFSFFIIKYSVYIQEHCNICKFMKPNNKTNTHESNVRKGLLIPLKFLCIHFHPNFPCLWGNHYLELFWGFLFFIIPLLFFTLLLMCMYPREYINIYN